MHLLCFVCNNLSFWFLVLQVHPSAHEVNLNLCLAVCCMVVGAVFRVFFFELGPNLAYALHVQRTQQLSRSNF